MRRFSYPRICSLSYSQPGCYFHFTNYFFCCCFRVSYIWFRLGQFFPTGYSWGGKTFQSVQQVSGEGGRSIFLSYHCISKSTKLSNFRCFQRYLLLGTKEWTILCFSEHGLIAFLHSHWVFSVSLVVNYVCFLNPKPLKIAARALPNYVQVNLSAFRARRTIGLFHWPTDEENPIKDIGCLQSCHLWE